MRIIILGNSWAAAKFVEDINATQPESEIIIFPFEDDRAVARDEMLSLIARQKTVDEIKGPDAEFYKKYGVRLITDTIPERVNFNRRQLTTKEKEKINFDYLLIDETGGNQWPAVRGVQKAGVFAFRRLCDAHNILNALPLADTVVVISDTLWGFKTACALRRENKQVILVTSHGRLLDDLFDEETTQYISDNLESWGLRLFLSQQVTELLGDSDIKAFRLASGKVISCQMVIFPDTKPEWKLFKDSGLSYQIMMRVSPDLATNMNNVFAYNRAIDLACITDSQDREIMLKQGEILAGNMTSDTKSVFTPPVAQGGFKFENFDFHFIGNCTVGKSTEVISKRNETQNGILKIMSEHQQPQGALFINWQNERVQIQDIISNKAGRLWDLEIFRQEDQGVSSRQTDAQRDSADTAVQEQTFAGPVVKEQETSAQVSGGDGPQPESMSGFKG